MYSHDDIWRGIDRLAQAKDMTPSAMARAAGLDATIFNKSKRVDNNGRPRWPSTETLGAVLQTTGTNLSEFNTIMRAARPVKKEPHEVAGLTFISYEM